MKCKKSIMGLAALCILIFHFYIPFMNQKWEASIWRGAYVGVDLFFFVSAYSISKRKEISSYTSFVVNRIQAVFVPLLVWTFVAAIYGKWEISRFFQVILGIEFLKKGGGAFLWFLTAIMLLYLIAPLLLPLKNRFQWKAFLLMMAFWGILVLLLQEVFQQTQTFILINRLPIFFMGLFYEDIRKYLVKKSLLPVSLVGLLVGIVLIYQYGSIQPLRRPIEYMYYLLAIPFVFSLCWLLDILTYQSKGRYLPLQYLGTCTLELYALQMIFGYKIEMLILKNTNQNKLLAFVATIAILIGIALFIRMLKWQIHKKGMHCISKSNAKQL